jgi:hypothetical protein
LERKRHIIFILIALSMTFISINLIDIHVVTGAPLTTMLLNKL